MKKSRFLTIAATLFLFSTISNAEVRINPFQEIAAASGMKVRTTYYKGQLIPVAELPEVEITESLVASRLMPARINNGEVTVIANLPEVEIAAIDPQNNKVPVTYNQGKPVATVFLPMVEISESLPVENMVAVTFQNGEAVAVVSLDEVEITGSDESVSFTPANAQQVNWNVNVQSNPALLVGHTTNDRYFLMSFEGPAATTGNQEVLIYRILNEVQGAITGGFRQLMNSVGGN